MSEKTVVNSWNEWDPLKHVIVGKADGTCIPAPEPALDAKVPEDSDMRGQFGPRTKDTVDKANELLDNFSNMLEKRGIKVDRPDPIDFSQKTSTPDWEAETMFGCMPPRDVLLTVGSEILEATMSYRCRWFEYLCYRPLIQKYYNEDPNMRHESAPKPRLTDAANALTALNCTPAEMTWKSGIDVLSFGATKNGCLAAEAIIFFNKDLVGNIAFLMKRAGHLLSKMRFVSAQLDAYISNDVWLRNARHANKMGKKLSEGLAKHNSIKLAYPTEANEVFAKFPRNMIEHLNSEGYKMNEDELDGQAVRLVAAWNTQESDVDQLLETLKKSN